MHLYIYKGIKPYVNAKTCIQMFKSTIFIIIKSWKKTICPSSHNEEVRCSAPEL